MTSRDDFTQSVKNALAKRAAFICAKPDCKVMTLAPSITDEEKFQYCGKAAHITAASKGGPHYDETLTPNERASINNAIFLCSNCADLVDKNQGIDYPAATLRDWKAQHDNWVLANLNKRIVDQASVHEIKSVITGGKSFPLIWFLSGPFNFDADGKWHQIQVELMLECKGEHALKNVEVTHSGYGYVSTTIAPTHFAVIYPNQTYKRLGFLTFEQSFVEQFPCESNIITGIGMANQNTNIIAENAEFNQRTILGIVRGHPLAPPSLTSLQQTITRREHHHARNEVTTVFHNRFYPSGQLSDWTVETVLASESVATQFGFVGPSTPIQRYAQ